MLKPWINWGLDQWLGYLENRNIQEIQLGLDRILEVAKRLNVHVHDCMIILVAGTNGKGSTVSALEMIYHTAGYKVGAYTSPHLIHFNERIRVNLTPIANDDLCQAFGFIEQIREQINLTYFEMTTLAALLYFKQLNLDIMILEVGLGGRLDATNIITPDLSIITTIDYDHQHFLGDTLEAIGYEKSGILRRDKPFIYADNNPPSSIVHIANNLNASGYFWEIHFSAQDEVSFWKFNSPTINFQKLPKSRIQLKSAAAAIMACCLLQQKLPVTQVQVCAALEKIYIPGRLEYQKGKVDVLYDVAHNVQSARLLAETIKKINTKGRVHAVFSALKDKDIYGLVFSLKDCVDLWYPAQLDNKRASSADRLLSKLEDAEISVDICYSNPLDAFQAALDQATAGDLIVVYGSFFTVGHVMTAQHNILEPKEIL